MTNKIFDHFQNWKPNLWQRIRLWFIPTQVSFDLGNGNDYSATTYFKVLGENIFIVNIKTNKTIGEIPVNKAWIDRLKKNESTK